MVKVSYTRSRIEAMKHGLQMPIRMVYDIRYEYDAIISDLVDEFNAIMGQVLGKAKASW